MPKKYPPLTLAEVRSILSVLGFDLKATRGSHAQFEDPHGRKVTLDLAVDEFGTFLLKSMIDQSGHSREALYGATKVTAKKINLR